MRRLSTQGLRMMAPRTTQDIAARRGMCDTTNPDFITWSTETFATNQNANAIRFGTLYELPVDADQGPNPTACNGRFFKTESRQWL